MWKKEERREEGGLSGDGGVGGRVGEDELSGFKVRTEYPRLGSKIGRTGPKKKLGRNTICL